MNPENETIYSVELIAELAGVSPQTVIHYHEIGIISPATDDLKFDIEGLRQLRRIEHLRHTHELTDSGLKFIAGLLNELEGLRRQLRNRTR